MTVGRRRRGGEVDRLFQRAVVVSDPGRVLADIQAGQRVTAHRAQHAIAGAAGGLGRGGGGDLAGVGQPWKSGVWSAAGCRRSHSSASAWVPSSAHVSIPARRSAASTWSHSRRLSMAASGAPPTARGRGLRRPARAAARGRRRAPGDRARRPTSARARRAARHLRPPSPSARWRRAAAAASAPARRDPSARSWLLATRVAWRSGASASPIGTGSVCARICRL